MSCPFFSDSQRAQERVIVLSGHVAGAPASGSEKLVVSATGAGVDYAAELRAAKAEIWTELCDKTNANPILIRAAWHDSGTFDKNIRAWPACGGANGSIRFDVEMNHGANAGLTKAVNVYLKPIKARHPVLSWADLLQLASATAVEHAGGPKIDMLYGRVDVTSAADCPPEGRLPAAAPPFGDGAKDAATHLRNVFYRMGFDDREIVALSGAHTMGRAFKERSGTVAFGYGDTGGTKHTASSAVVRADGKPGVGMPGGESWTSNWLTFDNSYFRSADDQQLLRLPTDLALATDESFRSHYQRYAASQAAFFQDYAAAHKKLSELGSAFYPAGGVRI